jgi:hypothetical protein
MEITFLVFAFGISSNLLRGVCIYRDKNTALSSLSYPSFWCQVDRRARRLDLVVRSWLGCACVLGGLLIGAPFSGAQEAALPPRGPLGLVWEAPLSSGALYYTEVAALIDAYEAAVGAQLSSGARGKVGLKVNTRGGRGLSTPLQLLRAVIEALEARGFSRDAILIVDYSAYELRQAGILPPLSLDQARFEGCPVLALNGERHYDADWFYDSPLPPALQQEPQLFSGLGQNGSLAEGAKERKSFLPAPLLFEVDFWINLAVGVDDVALGVDGALANATLWNVSNSQRFLDNPATASAAVAEIAAIPELQERMVLHFVSLERYQFIGGPRFNSLYSRSEPRLWMSGDPVALDRLLFDRMNTMRLLEGFPEIAPLPRQLPFAASLGLGVFEKSRIRVERLPLVTNAKNGAVQSDMEALEVELAPQTVE